MPHTRSGPAYNSYKSAHPRQISGRARRNSPALTFAAAARHAIHAATIHAATRLATGTRLAAGSTAGIAARARVGETKCRLQRIWLTRGALRCAAFATRTTLALALAGSARSTTLTLPLRRAFERCRRTRLAALERTLWLATARTTRFARTAGAAWTTLALRTGKLALRLATARRDGEWIGVAVAHIDAVAIRLVIAARLARFAALGGASGTGVARCRIFFSMP